MNFHIFNEKQILNKLDPIQVSMNVVAESFDVGDLMVGLFFGSGSEALIDGYDQTIVCMTPSVSDQFHVLISDSAPVANVGDFISDVLDEVNENPDKFLSMTEYSKRGLDAFFGRELTRAEAVIATMVILGITPTEENIRIGTGDTEDGKTFHYIVLRYGHVVENSPADVVIRQLLSENPTSSAGLNSPILH